jgi:signal-transduction protein with cAMP-binding, CBS, and nucleotidyltransferase domain
LSVPASQPVSGANVRLQSWPLGHDIAEVAAPDAQTIADCTTWLSFHRIWGRLGQESLRAIAQSLRLLTVETGTPLYEQTQTAIGLYLLKWGSVEIYRPSPVGRTHIDYRSAGDVFGYVPLVARV